MLDITRLRVLAGVGVSTLPALALAAHRHPDVVLLRIPGEVRHVVAATYGDPPDPPAVRALLDCLTGVEPSAPEVVGEAAAAASHASLLRATPP